jgi:ribosome-binding factor A
LTTPRMLKVNSVLREVIGEEVEKLSDSRLELATVTGVDTAPNLRRAVVYVDVLSDDYESVLEALNSAAPKLQRAIGKQVRIKYTPVLEFEIDPGILEGSKIDQILRTLQSSEEE